GFDAKCITLAHRASSQGAEGDLARAGTGRVAERVPPVRSKRVGAGLNPPPPRLVKTQKQAPARAGRPLHHERLAAPHAPRRTAAVDALRMNRQHFSFGAGAEAVGSPVERLRLT